jgi:D-arabinose 1-dehydrogenase-like Zn-dependent alcohol dehydrogenase
VNCLGEIGDIPRSWYVCVTGLRRLATGSMSTLVRPLAFFLQGNVGAEKSKPYGGFASYWRGPAKHAIPITQGIDLASAAPTTRGVITVYTP